MIDVAFPVASEGMTSPAAPRQNAHVIAWLRHHQQAKLTATATRAASYPAKPAFHRHQLELDIAAARKALSDAKAAVLLARGKHGKIDARRRVRIAAMNLSSAEAALAREDAGEKLATGVQRRDIVRPDGVVLREARVVINQNKRPELQPALERLRVRGLISKPCYNAARRYREVWELAGLNAFPGGLSAESGGAGSPASGNARIENAVGMGTELAAARHAVGSFGTAMLEHVVIEGLTLASWSERQGESEFSGKGMLVMVLNRLAEHWALIDAAKHPPTPAADAESQIRSLHGSI